MDIDGCLNNEARPSIEMEDLDSLNIDCLNKFLVELAPIEVVISSSWRKHWDLDLIKRHFVCSGIVANIIGETPDMSRMNPNSHPLWSDYKRYYERGDEIEAWLKGQNDRSDISFCIVDDCEDMVHLKPFAVVIDPMVGFVDSDLMKIKEVFTKQEGVCAEA